MTVQLDGFALDADTVRLVALDGAGAELAPGAEDRMRRSREVLQQVADAGQPVYGYSTGVGALKRVALNRSESIRFSHKIVLDCRVGVGPLASPEVVRATLLVLANTLARGTAGVRPDLAAVVLRALNEGWPLEMRSRGSVGEADLAPMADLAAGLLDRSGLVLEPGEGLAMVDNNCFATAAGALAVVAAGDLADALDAAAALDLEAFRANLSALDPLLDELRPYPGLRVAAGRLRGLLADSALWDPGAARNLQDPLSFRCLPGLHGALRDALDYAHRQTRIELNAAQNNPLVDGREGRVVAAGAFEILPFAAALDFLRIALAPALTATTERTMKLLHAGFSGLPPGLAANPEAADDGHTEFGVAAQAIAAEARLLAAPVTYEVVTTTQAEGIEDRMTLAPLAARRLAEMVHLGQELVAIELLIASRAADLRDQPLRLGRGTAAVHRLVRERIPPTRPGEPVPRSIEPLADLVRSGAVGRVERGGCP